MNTDPSPWWKTIGVGLSGAADVLVVPWLVWVMVLFATSEFPDTTSMGLAHWSTLRWFGKGLTCIYIYTYRRSTMVFTRESVYAPKPGRSVMFLLEVTRLYRVTTAVPGRGARPGRLEATEGAGSRMVSS